MTALKYVWLELYARTGRYAEFPDIFLRHWTPLSDLSNCQLETLVRHMYNVKSQIRYGTRPTLAIKLDRTRSVTWVHILHGQWLLTAASDSSISELSLWSTQSIFSAFAGGKVPTPSATSYLAGPVAQGLIDIYDGRVIIALEIRSS